MSDKDCYCFTCGKHFHNLGIARHRAMHRDKKERCKIMLSGGAVRIYSFDAKCGAK